MLYALLVLGVAILLCVGVMVYLFLRFMRRDATQDTALWKSIRALEQEINVKDDELKANLGEINQKLDVLGGTITTIGANVDEILGDLQEQKNMIAQLQEHELSQEAAALVESILAKTNNISSASDAIKTATDTAKEIVPEPATDNVGTDTTADSAEDSAE